MNETAAAAETLSAIYALTEFVDSLNSTEVRTTTKKGVERGEGRVGASKDLVLEASVGHDEAEMCYVNPIFVPFCFVRESRNVEKIASLSPTVRSQASSESSAASTDTRERRTVQEG